VPAFGVLVFYEFRCQCFSGGFCISLHHRAGFSPELSGMMKGVFVDANPLTEVPDCSAEIFPTVLADGFDSYQIISGFRQIPVETLFFLISTHTIKITWKRDMNKNQGIIIYITLEN